MVTASERVPIEGSDRTPMPGSQAIGPADPSEQAHVTVVVRPRAVTGYTEGSVPPRERHRRSREEVLAERGADPDHLARVEAFARAHGLTVVESSAARRSLRLSGAIADLCAAFEVELTMYDHPGGRYRGRSGRVHVPRDLSDVVVAVMGLDTRPQAQPHLRLGTGAHGGAGGGTPPPGAFTPPQIAALYDFPTLGTGSGQTVAIIELGAGYVDGDLATYFGELGITPAPAVTAVSVDGGANAPTGDPNSADAEVLLDIEVVGAVAPGANIVVYFAPNTDQGFLDAITTAVHDATNNPSVISISWGAAEAAWTGQALAAYDQAFQDAAHLGVTVCAAAGDNGSADGQTDGSAHADFPASDPYVLGCGGTTLTSDTSAGEPTIASEVVWNQGNAATGGGVSDVWDPPDYQAGAGVPPSLNPGGRLGRGVPDVAGDADPATGYLVHVDGTEFAIGGTSAVAPLWAGLLALVNEQLGVSAGFVNPVLYAGGSISAFRDITAGSNDITALGGYAAGIGWDACTGLGSASGERVLALLGGAGILAVGR